MREFWLSYQIATFWAYYNFFTSFIPHWETTSMRDIYDLRASVVDTFTITNRLYIIFWVPARVLQKILSVDNRWQKKSIRVRQTLNGVITCDFLWTFRCKKAYSNVVSLVHDFYSIKIKSFFFLIILLWLKFMHWKLVIDFEYSQKKTKNTYFLLTPMAHYNNALEQKIADKSSVLVQ